MLFEPEFDWMWDFVEHLVPGRANLPGFERFREIGKVETKIRKIVFARNQSPIYNLIRIWIDTVY